MASPQATTPLASPSEDRSETLGTGYFAKPPPPRTPGIESQMECRPAFEALSYQGSGKLQGMTALITGGDSGIGRAVAVLFAREGANVAIAYLNEHQDAQETCSHLDAEGASHMALAGDVRDPHFCQQAVQQVIEKFGALNILVNNAACQAHTEGLEQLGDLQLDETFRTNIYGYIYMARAALPYMQRGDSIINTGSITGSTGCPFAMDYATTKGAIHTFTKSLAMNVAERGIRVNAVAPGPVWTALTPSEGTEDDFASLAQLSPLGRVAQPEDISPAYVFLAAPCSASCVTGVVLPVGGLPPESL